MSDAALLAKTAWRIALAFGLADAYRRTMLSLARLLGV